MKWSIFSQPFEQVVFIGYFLGAVVPLVALGVLVERHLPSLNADALAAPQLLILFASMAVLSLGCFAMLRLISRRTLDRIIGDQARLKALLGASRSLAFAPTEFDAAESTALAALRLADARAAYVILRSREPGKPPFVASAGDDAEALYELIDDPLREIAEIAIAENRIVTIPAGGWDLESTIVRSASVVPLSCERDEIGALCILDGGSDDFTDATRLDALSTLAGLASVALRNTQLHHQQRNFFSHLTELLVRALDTHLDYHHGHSVRVARYCHHVGKALNLAEARLERLHFAALLHDVGMLRIDRRVRHDRQICKAHPRHGERMLRGILVWTDVAQIVLHHHEWFDGRGYPDGIRGEQIPLESRIIAVCDSFDSITSSSSYKQARPVSHGISEIEAGVGTQFDPRVARCFIELVKKSEIRP